MRREILLPRINEGVMREGYQAVIDGQGVSFTGTQQIEVARLLGNLGVDSIEIGSPVISRGALRDARDLVHFMHDAFPSTPVLVHARARKADIDAALAINDGKYKIGELELYRGTSPENRKGNGNHSIDEIIEESLRAINYIHEQDPSLFVRFGTEDGFRTPLKDLLKVIYYVAPHVNRISIPDTTGGADPFQVFTTILMARIAARNKPIQFHGHNDIGLVGGNYYAAIRAGAEVLDTSVFALGERNGIMDLRQMIMMMYRLYGREAVKNKYHLKYLEQIYQKVEEYLGSIPSNFRLGPNAQTDGAGVHQAAQRKNSMAYRIVDSTDFGETSTNIIIASAVVGANAIQMRAEQIGRDIDREQARLAAAEIQNTARSTEGGISPEEADAIVRRYST
ncbi:hypothetical protein A3C28_04565 [Candidatus Roizmanbacteria bacterium RIFCSPHIGHO2_02_FULL_39_9]|uniref:Pyruvate carboxyltransferase domain-containing protein n=1 Tax=Candidatus Roizmanbacteria bacterium RIFCSPHIGHO2_02_FULL_39_9 TaxID=1802040 RepID=A0A1F7H2W9_9BACT|nr:MAG: hypothetical protein A3C28_04565 [Candidatus Roizmanbacteria bacterium RIFCSPHIGHO2_02_FULL_39_9]